MGACSASPPPPQPEREPEPNTNYGKVFPRVKDEDLCTTTVGTYEVTVWCATTWKQHDVQARTHVAFEAGFFWLAQVLRAGEIKRACSAALTNHVEFFDRPQFLEEVSVLQRVGNAAAGNFGDVFVADWPKADGEEQHRESRVFVKRQRNSPQFATECAVLIVSVETALPTPRLLAMHQDDASDLLTTVQSVSRGQAAERFFAESRDLPTKLRAALVFAFTLKCCHEQRILHNDVALRNFMTDGESCFHIVDFGLALVAKEGHSAVPYLHDSVAFLQSAPELFETGCVSTATDVFQFGWMLHELFSGSSFIRTEFPPTMQHKVSRLVDDDAYASYQHFEEVDFLGAVRTLRPPPPDDDDEEAFPPAVFDVCMRCLDPEPSTRATIDNIIADLAQLLARVTPQLASVGDTLGSSKTVREAYSTFLQHGDVDGARLLAHSFSPLPFDLDLFESIASGEHGEELSIVGRGAAFAVQGACALASCMRDQRTITTVVLDSNELACRGVAELGPLVAAESPVRSLSLVGNLIQDDGAVALADCAQHSTSLRVLNLFDNQIGDRGAQALADLLANNADLRINLVLNSVSDAVKDELRETHGDRIQWDFE